MVVLTGSPRQIAPAGVAEEGPEPSAELLSFAGRDISPISIWVDAVSAQVR